MIYLTIDQVLALHEEVLTLGGAAGVRSAHLLGSAVLQAQQSAFGEEAYATLAEKAAAYAFCLIQNHPFVDGNKRTGEAAMMMFLELNGYEFIEDEPTIAQVIADLAAGVIEKDEFFGWVINHAKPARPSNVIAINE